MDRHLQRAEARGRVQGADEEGSVHAAESDGGDEGYDL